MPKEFVIDLFSGAGGTSTGIHLANCDSTVIACVNHDKNAIESHRLNHPFSKHFIEDIRNPEVVWFLKIRVEALRKLYPDCIITIWASLECTNFSKAKGGMSRDADSRTLAEHLFMYIEALKPDYLMIENVVEFMEWGPLRIKQDVKKSKKNKYSTLVLDSKSKKKSVKYSMVPIKAYKGIFYQKWLKEVKAYGFDFDFKIINSADLGSVQSRKRYFAQFAANDLPIAWPTETHSKAKRDSTLFNSDLRKWKSVKDVLDLENEGTSIFTRKKPLVDNTLDVIYKGIIKALKENEDVFMYKYYSNGDNYNSINSPAGTVTTKDRFGKIQIIFNQYKTGYTSSIDSAIGAVTTNPKQNVLSFIMNPSHGGHTTGINKPSPTIIARQDKAPLYLIKVLMQKHGIADIKMRMLEIKELLRIQGFPEDYKLVGTKTQQKKYIGNAVEVNTAKAIFEAHHKALDDYFESLSIAA